MSVRVTVFGPAYVDRVLRVDAPLGELPGGSPLDRSVEGKLLESSDAPHLELVDQAGQILAVSPPVDWPGPLGRIAVTGIQFPASVRTRLLHATGWCDDLGGMGAGYAAALGGRLIHALGAPQDPSSREVERLIRHYEIAQHAIRVADQSADWTLLVSSGAHGDKLAVGFRGCHAALTADSLDPWLTSEEDLRVVAGLQNPLAAHVLRAAGTRCRLFAPGLRNMRDRDCPVSSFAAEIDVLCCNRLEWETLEDREEVGWRVSILVVTDGPEGSWARFTGPLGETGTIRLPAFPRTSPPRDTNRAGESFAATLISTLLDHGWIPQTGVVAESLMNLAMRRASAASACVLDREEFGFPDDAEIDRALACGRVGP